VYWKHLQEQYGGRPVYHAVENDKDGLKDFRAFSAGLSAFEDDWANPKAVKVLKEHYNVDISSHRARKITKSDVESSISY